MQVANAVSSAGQQAGGAVCCGGRESEIFECHFDDVEPSLEIRRSSRKSTARECSPGRRHPLISIVIHC